MCHFNLDHGLEVTLPPDWLSRQIEIVQAEIATWPEWMRNTPSDTELAESPSPPPREFFQEKW